MNARILPALVLGTLTTACSTTGPRFDTFSSNRLTSCTTTSSAAPVSRVVMIGDAGDANTPTLIGDGPATRSNVFVLDELQGDVEGALVVFLGDNTYSLTERRCGYPWNGGLAEKEDAADECDKASLRQLEKQVRSAVDGRAKMIRFVPGNHDYYRSGEPGLKRMAKVLTAMGQGADVALVPKQCTGPMVESFSEHVVLVSLDTEWFLATSGLSTNQREACDVTGLPAALTEALTGATEKTIIVAAHHPLFSYGKHGRASELVALITGQDLATPDYAKFRKTLLDAFQPHALYYAAGHEHGLQLVENERQIHIGSGGGTESKPRDDELQMVGDFEQRVLFAANRAGYFILDILADGTHQLTVVEYIETTPGQRGTFKRTTLQTKGGAPLCAAP